MDPIPIGIRDLLNNGTRANEALDVTDGLQLFSRWSHTPSYDWICPEAK
jgi:hypothetical protein